jgi:predicted branched-subunit amino acid permease
MGISLAPVIKGGLPRRFFCSQLMVDESWAVSSLGGGKHSLGRLVGAGILVYIGWVGGTAVGVLGARFLGDPQRFGLDVVSPVIFLALLRAQIRDKKMGATAVLGAAIALVVVPFASPGIPLVAAIGASLLGLWK